MPNLRTSFHRGDRNSLFAIRYSLFRSVMTKKTIKHATCKEKTPYTSPERLQKIFAALDRLFPQAQCSLRHENAF